MSSAPNVGAPDGAETSSTPRRGYREALAQLRAAQKPSAGTPAYSRYVNRPLGRRIAALGYVWGWTPNGVTALSATSTLVGIVLLATVHPALWLGVLICVLLLLGYALDSTDGQLARLRGGGSLQGEWLDHTVDAAKLSLLHLAILISAFRFFDVPLLWLLVPAGYLVVDNVMFFSMILKELLTRGKRSGQQAAPVSTSRVRALLIIPTDYGLFCLMFLLLGVPVAFVTAYTAMFVCNAIILVLVLVKWYRFTGSFTAEATPARRKS